MKEPANEKVTVLFLDLSGNENAARQWASQQFCDQPIQFINKADLKWSSKRQALAKVRRIQPHTFAIFTNDIGLQSARCPMMLFGAFAGARRIVLGDSQGRIISRSRFMATLLEAPRLVFEFLSGYALLVPFSW